MKQFNYKARDPEGKTLTGVVESTDPMSAAKTLQDHGLLVVSVNEKRQFSDMSIKGLMPGVSKVSALEVATFTRLIATMLKTRF